MLGISSELYNVYQYISLADPLLMNAFNTVNLAGACILTSTEHAQKLGIPKDKWVYVLGGAGTSDSSQCKYRQRSEPVGSTQD